ncbi:hypothetical protein DW047_05175 [Phocaeicola vulgatus]|nr:hypothetical protein DW047_05175 [Phocaeicola vulgatus]
MVSGNVDIHIIEVSVSMADTLFFFWEIFLHDLILPPGGIKSEFIMREILIGRKSKSKVQVKRIKCSFSSRL